MKAKLVVEGKEFDIEIQDKWLQNLVAPPEKKTGYERVDEPKKYYYQDYDGSIQDEYDENECFDTKCYDEANYYSDKTVAENNARADKLMRQLRRFAVEHREKELDWEDSLQSKYILYYNHTENRFIIDDMCIVQDFGAIYFDLRETAQLALDTYHDELIWYFTEYKDSL